MDDLRREEASGHIARVEQRLAALEDAGVDVGALHGQLRFARRMLQEQRYEDVTGLCDELLVTAGRIATGEVDTDPATRAITRRVRSVLGGGSGPRADDDEQEAMVDALARAVAQQLADQATANETTADPAFTARLERTVSAQMEGLRNSLEADIRGLREAMTRDLHVVAKGTGEPELLRAALDDMESDLLKKLRDSLRRRMQNMESGFDERFAHLQDSLGTLSELDGRLEQFQDIRERLQQLDAMEQRLEGLFAAAREPATVPAGSGEFPMSESRASDDDASAFREAITGLERHVGYGGIPPITDARAARPDDVDDAPAPQLAAPALAAEQAVAPAADAVDPARDAGVRASLAAENDPFDHMLAESGAAPQPEGAPAPAPGQEEPPAPDGEPEAAEEEGPAGGVDSPGVSQGYRGRPVTAERSPSTEQLDAQAPEPPTAAQPIDALFDAVVSPSTRTAAAGAAASTRAADRGSGTGDAAVEAAAEETAGARSSTAAQERAPEPVPGTASIDQLFAGLEPAAADPTAATASAGERGSGAADAASRTMAAQSEASGAGDDAATTDPAPLPEAPSDPEQASSDATAADAAASADPEAEAGSAGGTGVADEAADPAAPDAADPVTAADMVAASDPQEAEGEASGEAGTGPDPGVGVADPEVEPAAVSPDGSEPDSQTMVADPAYDEAPTESMDPIEDAGDPVDQELEDALAAMGRSAPALDADPESAPVLASEAGSAAAAAPEAALGAAPESAPAAALVSETPAAPESAPAAETAPEASVPPEPVLDAEAESALAAALEPEAVPTAEDADCESDPSDQAAFEPEALPTAEDEPVPASGPGDPVAGADQTVPAWSDAGEASSDDAAEGSGSALIAGASADAAPSTAGVTATEEPASMLASLRACLPDLLADPATRQMLVTALAPELGATPTPDPQEEPEPADAGMPGPEADASEPDVALVGDATASAADADPLAALDAGEPDAAGADAVEAAPPDFEPDAATPPAAAALVEPAAEASPVHELDDLFGQLAAEASEPEAPPAPQEEPESLGIGHGPAEPPDFTPQEGDEVLDVELAGMSAELAAALPDDDAIPVAHTVGVAAAAPATQAPAPAAAQPAVAAATADPGMVANQLRAQLPELLRDEEVKQALFATLATEVVSRGSALGELTGLRRFVEAEIRRQLASLGSGAWG